MENTSNYGLKRWDGGALTLHTEFNDNWDKIDTAIKGSEDKAAAALAATTALEQKMGLQHTFRRSTAQPAIAASSHTASTGISGRKSFSS